MTRREALGGLGAAVALLARAAEAKAFVPWFEMFVWNAELIVVARVESIEKFDGLRVAKARLVTAHKGQPEAEFYVVADPTWTCDASDAVKGETALLFLRKAAPGGIERQNAGLPPIPVTAAPLYTLLFSGRGRMPITKRNGKDVVSIMSDVGLREELIGKRRVPGEPSVVLMGDLEREIRRGLCSYMLTPRG